ncbi:unnamed protein product [Bemisia tabaci]|uniref:INO80 complex subunit E N-terminal domain-containing protein n=1 Tax=Bemisia tabaci TaxID=7038 RepID=A0A9P0F9Y7_BEMTA|nr:unnamed protein product [Bemisia tabaci]
MSYSNFYSNFKGGNSKTSGGSLFVKDEKPNVNYRRKYLRMKRLVKAYLFENAALCDHVAQTQEKILVAKEERNFLLKKLEQHQTLRANLENRFGNLRTASPLSDRSGVAPKRPGTKKRTNSDAIDNGKMGPGKPKRMLMAVKKCKLPQQIALDSAGRPIFPIALGNLTVYSLGEVIYTKPTFHSEETVYPVGFVSTREYTSVFSSEATCTYTCKVSDGGMFPRFEISSETDLDIPIVGQSPDECHSKLLALLRQNLGIHLVNLLPRGADFFGFSHPCILNLLQSFPNTRKCSRYIFTKFEPCRSGEVNDPTENNPSISHTALQRSIIYSRMNFN